MKLRLAAGICLVLTLAAGGIAVAVADTSYNVLTVPQLLSEFQTCKDQNLPEGCLTPARMRDIIGSIPNVASIGPLTNVTITGGTVSGLTSLGIAGTMTSAPSFPASFGSTPVSNWSLNVGNYPINETDPQGKLDSITSMMVVPSTFTLSPHPNSTFSCYLKSANPTAGNSNACLYGFVGSFGDGADPYGDSIIVSNALYGLGAGAGHDFTYLIGSERDIGVFTKPGAVTPAGTAFGYNAVTFSNTAPTGGTHGHNCRLGAPGSQPFGECFRSEDGAATTGILIGAQAASANSSSQLEILSANPPTGPAVQSSRQLAASGAQINDNSQHTGGAFHFLVPGGGIAATTHQTLATGAALSSENTAMSLNLPLELIASQYLFSGGNVGIGTGASAPGATLDIAGSLRSSGAANLGASTLSSLVVSTGSFTVDGSGNIAPAKITATNHIAANGPIAAIGSGFGTSPSIAGSDTAGRVTVGSGGAASGVVTFGGNFNAAPACHANDETTSQLIRATATATQLTLTGTMAAADKITYICLAYQ
jgi:hypothetical protein